MRIVAGRWRGRHLVVPSGAGHRPTQGKVREAIFSRLGQRVAAAVVLDLFAGSGALGLEALSRGARRAVFVEKSRAAISALRRNIEGLDAGCVSRVVAGDVFDFLEGRLGRTEGVTLLFADPPYGRDAPLLAERLAEAGGFAWAPGAIQVIECSTREDTWPPSAGWQRWAVREYGETRIVIDEKEATNETRA